MLFHELPNDLRKYDTKPPRAAHDRKICKTQAKEPGATMPPPKQKMKNITDIEQKIPPCPHTPPHPHGTPGPIQKAHDLILRPAHTPNKIFN